MTTTIGIVSDLHLHHWRGWANRYYLAETPLQSVTKAVQTVRPKILIDAGDFEQQYKINDVRIITTPGNHDYYGSTWLDSNWLNACQCYEIEGLVIATTTLWVDFNGGDPHLMKVFKDNLADCSCIAEFTPEIAYETHKRQKDWLLKVASKTKIDIVVTHHTPTLKAIHPRFLQTKPWREMSYGFSSDLDELVREIKPKYWIFGHTHDPYDFWIGETHMLSNPCGYPSEKLKRRLPYQPVFIEV